MYLDQQLKTLDDKTLTAQLKIVRDAQAKIPLRFRWMVVNRAVDKLIEKLKADQGNAEDLVHLALPSVEEAPFDSNEAALQGFAKTSSDVAVFVVDRRKK